MQLRSFSRQVNNAGSMRSFLVLPVVKRNTFPSNTFGKYSARFSSSSFVSGSRGCMARFVQSVRGKGGGVNSRLGPALVRGRGRASDTVLKSGVCPTGGRNWRLESRPHPAVAGLESLPYVGAGTFPEPAFKNSVKMRARTDNEPRQPSPCDFLFLKNL